MDIFFMAIICVAAVFIAGGIGYLIKKHRNNSRSVTIYRTGGTSHQNQRSAVNSTNGSRPQRSSSAQETEVMDYFANARHNQTDNWFRFQYKHVGDEWRAYIVRMPSLNGRSGDLHSTHRYSDSNGNYWVCRDPQPTNLKDCQIISKAWADRLLEYIATGVEANSQRW